MTSNYDEKEIWFAFVYPFSIFRNTEIGTLPFTAAKQL